MPTMDWSAHITSITNAHSDLLEMVDKLEDFCTDAAGTTTFSLTSGDTIVDNIAKISSDAAGAMTVEAGVNTNVNDPVMFYDDSGVKSKPITVPVKNTSTEFDADADGLCDSTWDSDNDRFVIFYQNSTSYDCNVILGTIPTNKQMTYNTPLQVHNGAGAIACMNLYTAHCSGDATSGTLVFVYVDHEDSDTIKYRVATNDGTTVTLGTEGTLTTTNDLTTIKCTYDATLNKIAVIHKNDSKLFVTVASISGSTKALTNLSANNQISTANVVNYFDVVIDPNSKDVLCFYKEDASSAEEMVRAYGPIDGAPAFKSEYSYLQNSNGDAEGDSGIRILDVRYDVDNDVCLVLVNEDHYDRGNNNNIVLYKIKTFDDVIGATNIVDRQIFLGTFPNVASSISLGGYIDIESGKIFYTYYIGSSNGAFVEGDMMGSYIETLNVYEVTTATFCKNPTFVNDQLLVFNGASHGVVIECDKRYKFCGIAQDTITAGNNSSISAIGGGASTNHTALSVGRTYYLQKDLTFGTTITPYSVGKALSTTQIKLY